MGKRLEYSVKTQNETMLVMNLTCPAPMMNRTTVRAMGPRLAATQGEATVPATFKAAP